MGWSWVLGLAWERRKGACCVRARHEAAWYEPTGHRQVTMQTGRKLQTSEVQSRPAECWGRESGSMFWKGGRNSRALDLVQFSRRAGAVQARATGPNLGSGPPNAAKQGRRDGGAGAPRTPGSASQVPGVGLRRCQAPGARWRWGSRGEGCFWDGQDGQDLL